MDSEQLLRKFPPTVLIWINQPPMPFRRFHTITFVWLFASLCSSVAVAGELALGLAGIDEGDDRYRPAAAFQLGIGDHFVGRLYSYGRKLGPYTERTFVSGLNYRFLAFGKNTWGTVGGSTLLEETRYEPKEESELKGRSKRQYNVGTTFGLSYRVPIRKFYLAFNWDAHLYLAGSAGIFLSTGRKHMLGMTTGVAW